MCAVATTDDQPDLSGPDDIQLSDLVDRLYAYGRRVEDQLRAATDRATAAEADLEHLRTEHTALQEQTEELQQRTVSQELAAAHAADVVSAAKAEAAQLRSQATAELALEREAMQQRERAFVEALRTYLKDINEAQSSLLQIARRALGGTDGGSGTKEPLAPGPYSPGPHDPGLIPGGGGAGGELASGNVDGIADGALDPSPSPAYDDAATDDTPGELTPLPHAAWVPPTDEEYGLTTPAGDGEAGAAPVEPVAQDLPADDELTTAAAGTVDLSRLDDPTEVVSEPVSGEHQLIDHHNRLDLLRLRSGRRLFGSYKGAHSE